MNQALKIAADSENEPLNWRQKAFARELGVAIAKGGRDEDLVCAYAAVGYKPNRGNARRLASDPRIRKLAEGACAEALYQAGLNIQYLQAKALELLHASPTKIFRAIKAYQAVERSVGDKPPAEAQAELDAALDAVTWPLSEFKIDKDGIIAIKLPDKKALIEMLAKQLGVGQDTNVNVGLSLEELVLKSYQAGEEAKDVTPKKTEAA